MNRVAGILFGRAVFSEQEEYLAFRFRFLIVLMVTGALVTLAFLIPIWAGLLTMHAGHVRSMTGFTLVTLGLWGMLRGHQKRFLAVAWAYEMLCLIEYTSALIQVSEDELRLLWFYINIPGVYIILGQRAGLAITLLTLGGLAFINPYLAAPYSLNAMVTALLAMAYLGMFFHVYGDRSLSYFARLQASNRRLQQMASHDPLTGVLNARAYYETADRMIQAARRQGHPYAVLFVDLDHFKRINDTHGHAAGDQVLRSVAACLSASLRTSDLLGRIGGEEFSIFLPDTRAEDALRVAEHLRATIETTHPRIDDGLRLTVTASIGVASSEDRASASMLDIQRSADQAMYDAKRAGRNRVSRCSGADAAAGRAATARP